MRLICALAIPIMLANSLSCHKWRKSEANNYTIHKEHGSSIKTVLSDSIILNKKSSLSREWFHISDPDCPVQITKTTGIETYFSSDERFNSYYYYKSACELSSSKPITAVSISMVIFDVFGNYKKTLGYQEVEDLNGNFRFEPTWKILNENEASTAFASVMFISQARTSEGNVYNVNYTKLREKINTIYKNVTEEDLDIFGKKQKDDKK